MFSANVKMTSEDWFDLLKYWLMADMANNFATLTELYDDYDAWCEENDVKPWPIGVFALHLKADKELDWIKANGRIRFRIKFE
jgi:hypothetical protein